VVLYEMHSVKWRVTNTYTVCPMTVVQEKGGDLIGLTRLMFVPVVMISYV
jgi:hypothetical protein